ncbi:hypothetical protein PVT67_08295 [Gallaecimonas kandeliae]|uniref:hypothetical protein n=1 Tax=Gallaecimonas kandeliae TaxID=3029055 RepID=UPI0026477760|nr:hypothetical protein [Gallaecimonas kandeliae]WKE67222.1 hypothetical protein PVT67_08295 [Gallaecimonas kandeliae]
MKIKILPFLLLFPAFCFSGEGSHSFKLGNNSFELKYKTKDVTTIRGPEDLVLFSVYKNGKFIHSEKIDDGRFFSCKYEKLNIVPLNTVEKQAGWMLTGGGVCGNTFSYNVELIIPDEGDESSYHSKNFISKEIPLIKPLKNGFSLWYYEQNWGHGGTATSFFVPSKIDVNLNDEFFRFKKGDILTDIKTLENSSTSKWAASFMGLFSAGIRDVNPALMQYALDNYYNDDQKELIAVHFGKSDKEYLHELIEKAKVTKDLVTLINGITAINSGD